MMNKYLVKAGSTALATLIIAAGLGAPAQAVTTPSPNAINTYSRAAVASAYANQWLPATNSPINWTGDAASCNAGTESADSLAKGAQALNFYRGLAGLDSINLTTSQNATAQTTALLMEANGMISHYPDASWKCYTQLGAQGASTSNLYGGAGSFQITSAAGPIKAYMDESGASNAPVGHRRWVLNPSTVSMGMGTTKGFNALNVVGAPTDANRTSPTMISFPGSGYFPQQLEPKGKWSVSSAQGVDFSGATVNVKDANGTALGVTPLSTAEGYGPNTLSFQVQGLAYASGNGEANYTVTVDNMKKNNLPFSYTYTVRLFDGTVSTSSVVPAEPMPTLPTTAVSVVAQSPTFGATNYTIPTTTGVVYKVNGVVWQAGTYSASTPITITAVAASGYTLTGAATWSKDFTPVVVQPINVTPTAPTFGATTYTVPYQAGVDYKVNGGSTLQGTYTASAPVTITAVALSGYTLSGTTTWTKDYTPVAQLIQVTPVAPALGSASYAIPVVTGVDYLVDGVVKAAGMYDASTRITITAVAKAGYVLSGTSTWTKDFTPVAQPILVTAVAPTLGATSYTIPTVTGVDYLVNNSVKAAGTYTASTNITITAVAKTGYSLSGTATWTKNYTPVAVTAVAPTLGATSYTIPTVTGVDYLVNNSVKAAGTYTASTNITITAVAKTGYTLSGTVLWMKDYTPVVAQPIQVTAVAPTLGATSYTIPTVTGIDYKVDNVVKAAGTYTATTNVTITAVAKTGYTLSGTATWTKDFTVVKSAIAIKAASLNGGLGAATSGEVYGLRNGGGYQTFQHGAIIWSPATGARISVGAIRGLWAATGYENGSMGYPTSDEIADGRGGVSQTYENGAIIWSPTFGTTISTGGIRGLWLATGGVKGDLGYPTSNEILDGRGGVYQNYERGAIVWAPSIGATISVGAIRGLWLATGGVNGYLGYPTSNETADGRGGVYQTYERGAVVWGPNVGATISVGAIRSMWLSTGGVNGRLGYPTTNEYATTSGNVAQNYQGGVIRWGTKGNTITYK